MKTWCAVLFFVVAWLGGTAEAGKGAYELMPLVGFQVNEGMDLAGPRNDHMHFQDKPLIGLSLGYTNDEQGQLELVWTHSESAAVVDLAGGAPPETFDVNIDRIHLNGLHMYGNDRLQPFVLFGAGATRYSPSGPRESTLRFSFAVGGGAKWFWTKWLGMRFDGRWTPTVALRGSHFFCDTDGSGACYSREPNSYFGRLYPIINNLEFTSGLFFRY